MIQTAFISGATGGFGSEVAKAFLGRGWRVRALHRNPKAAAKTGVAKTCARFGPVDWVEGDAMAARDVIPAAKGAAVIVHGVNPPGYRNWRGLAVPMLEGAIEAARASGARLVFPGNVYNFGPDAFPLLREDSPQNPATRKGAVRKEMEQMLADADGVRTLIVRAGDFFGPHAPASWFGNAMVKPGKPVRSVTHPGAPGAGHAWAFLPDLAEAIARLVEAEDRLDAKETVHFAGHWLTDGREMAHAVRRAAGDETLRIRNFPWPAVYALSPFVPLFRELIEMRYLWREPVRLDNARLTSLIGAEPHTPLDDAVRATLKGLGCFEAAPPASRPAPASAH